MSREKDVRILEVAHRLILRFGYRNVSMKDIAEECRISRPTLYKSFQSKEAIIEGLIEQQFIDCLAVTENLAAGSNLPLQVRLEIFFETWIIEPTVLAIETDAGRDLLLNVEHYVPAAVAGHYRHLEAHLREIIEPDLGDRGVVCADNLARILMLAAKALKSSSHSLGERRALVSSLIAMAVASTQSAPPAIAGLVDATHQRDPT